MEKMKYAAGFLLLTLPADEVDVNIHPMKTDVRFVDQQAIFMFVKRGIEQSFSGLTSTQFVSLNSSGKNCSLPATNGYDFSKKSSPQTEDYSSYSQPQLFSAEEMQTDDFRILGQYHQSYIIVEKNDQLLIIDQHNAHERINFERLLKNFTENSIQATSPLFPIIMELTPSEKQIYDQFSAIAIEKIGFGLEPIGGQSFSITKYPSILEENDIVGMLRILLNIPEVSMTDLENFVHQAFAEIACKSAVKVNTTLHPEKMKQIVRDLWKTQNPFLCPHKRPIIKQFSLEDIERFLKRR
jgi:DNA mismatch repair protein MutL